MIIFQATRGAHPKSPFLSPILLFPYSLASTSRKQPNGTKIKHHFSFSVSHFLPILQDNRMTAKKSPEELKKIFEKYAAKEGDPDQLSKDELKLLIQAEFPTLLKGPSTLDELFKELDKNGDGEVSFDEFQVLIKKIAQ
uniref:Protein S100 n=2 Tax=Oryctolagus cuniculus TaxID=9986 RepID=G1TLE0_RABIT